MKKINVLHLITSLNIGGTEKYLLTIAKSQKRRYNLSVGFLKERGEIAEELEREKIPVYDLGNPWRLLYFLKKKKIHLLHTHLYRANILGRFVGRAAKVPIVISSQRSIDAWKRFYHRWLDGWSSHFADCIIANSQVAKKTLVERERIPRRKIRVIYSGIESGVLPLRAERDKIKRSMGIEKNAVIVGCITRLHTEKGAQYIPAVGQKLKERIPQLRLLIVGDGPLMGRIKREIEDLELTDTVSLLGWRKDIANLLSIMDVFFLPSLEESFPRAVIEALVMARPAVATDVGGVGEIIQDRVHGLLVPPKDPKALAQAILWMLKNKKEAQEMANRGRRKVEKYFTVNRMMEETEKVYNNFIQEKLF
jgi:glycosyltransferase involved in cell wall biosynthesis